jgi:hypothetical protein
MPDVTTPNPSASSWPPGGEVSQDEKTMAMVSWLLIIVSTFVGPLVIYLIKKDQSKFIAFHAMQGILVGVAVAVLWGACGLGFILALIVGIMYGLKANKGEWAEVPMAADMAKKQVSS